MSSRFLYFAGCWCSLPYGLVLQIWYALQELLVFTFHEDKLDLDRSPWCGLGRPLHSGALEDMQHDKIHPCFANWDYLLALELIARTCCCPSKRIHPFTVTLEDVQGWWASHDSHCAPEAHLPGIIPVDYIDTIFIKSEKPVAPSIMGAVQYALVLDIKKATYDYFGKDSVHRRSMPSGFCLTTHLNQSDAFIPLCVPGKSSLSFVLRGGSLQMKICKSVSLPIKEFTQISFNEDNSIDVSAVSPSTTSPLGNLPASAQIYEAVGYNIHVDSLRQEATIVRVHDQMKSSFCFAVGSQIYVAISSSTGAPQVWNLTVTPHTPDPVPPRITVPEAMKDLPTCKNPQYCEIIFNSKKEAAHRTEHENKFKHYCIYGQGCNERSNPDHATKYLHFVKQACTEKKCEAIFNKEHRNLFFHDGLWSWMLPCKHGPGCTQKSNIEHCKKYFH